MYRGDGAGGHTGRAQRTGVWARLSRVRIRANKERVARHGQERHAGEAARQSGRSTAVTKIPRAGTRTQIDPKTQRGQRRYTASSLCPRRLEATPGGTREAQTRKAAGGRQARRWTGAPNCRSRFCARAGRASPGNVEIAPLGARGLRTALAPHVAYPRTPDADEAEARTWPRASSRGDKGIGNLAVCLHYAITAH